MVAPELKLTKKGTADKEGAGPPSLRIVYERRPEVEPRRFHVLSADIEAHGHTGGCPGCGALASHGKATKPHDDECRERIRTIIGRILAGKARMNAFKTESLRQSESKRGNELELREVQEMCLWYVKTDMMRKLRFDMRTHLPVTSEKTQHEVDRMRKTVRFEQEASSASASSDPAFTLEYPASGATQSRPGSVLVQTSGHVDDDVQISALDPFDEMDGRKSRYIGRSVGMASRRRCRRSQEK